MSTIALFRRRRRHWSKHRKRPPCPGLPLSRGGPLGELTAQSLWSRSAGRDRCLESGLAGIGAAGGPRHRDLDLPGRGRLLGVRTPPRVDAKNSGRRTRGGGSADRADRHRLPLRQSSRHAGTGRPSAQSAHLQRTDAQSPGGLADASGRQRPHQGHRPLRLPDFYGPGVEASLIHGAARRRRERRHGRHGRSARSCA